MAENNKVVSSDSVASCSDAVDELTCLVKNKLVIEENLEPATKRKRTTAQTQQWDDSIQSPKTESVETEENDDFQVTAAKKPKLAKTTPLESTTRDSIKALAYPSANITALKNKNEILGRESQLSEILTFLRSNIINGRSGFIYISGDPGTGKTATVFSALNILNNEEDVPEFIRVDINGIHLGKDIKAVYAIILKKLTGESVQWKEARVRLNSLFSNARKIPTVFVIDEVDELFKKKNQQVGQDIMEWGALQTAKLIVLAISIDADLPERQFDASMVFRIGLARLHFPLYSAAQLQAIVSSRPTSAALEPDALLLMARKVEETSGNARSVIALCTRALQMGQGTAGLGEATRAIKEAFPDHPDHFICRSSPLEKVVMRAVAAEVERTGSKQTTLSHVLRRIVELHALGALPFRPSSSICWEACTSLADSGLLDMKPGPEGVRLVLKISVDAVLKATDPST